ncbi:MAG: autotransporter-associated beta strand repeat-containing protein [Gemmataceae bacterium]
MKRHVWTRWLRALIPHTVRNVSHQTRSRRLSVEDLEIRLAPATRIWDGGGTTPNWGEAANWQGDALPQNGDDLLFPSGVAKTDTFNNIANSTYNLISFSGSGYRLAGLEITLGSTGPNTGYIVANLGTTLNTIDLDITMGGLAGNRQFFSVGTVGATLTINGALKGNTGVELSKDGPGILILTGNNQQFTGPISIVEGALSARHVNALGDTSAPTTVLSTFARSGQLQIEGITGDIQETLRLNGPGAANDGALLNVSGNNTWAGSIILDTSSIIGANTGTSLTVTGVISDSGAGQNLTKEGAGTIILDPLNTASGNTYRGQTIINDGILQIRHSLALGNDPVAVTNPLAGLVNNTVVASFPNRSGTLQLDFVANAQRIDPFVNPGNDGFTLPYESLTLNGPGIEGIHVFPKQPMPNGSTVTGALSNARGNNFVSQDVFLWSDDSTVLGDINRWSFGGNTLPTVGIGAEAGSTLTFTGHIVDTNLTGTPDYSLIKTRQGRVVFVNANSYRGKTEVLQGFLRIQDSQALGSASGGAIDGTWVFPQAALEIEADSIPDSQAGTYTDPPHGLPHLPTDIIISNELLRPMGDGFNNSGSVVNIRGVNELTGPFMMQQIIPRGNVSFVDTGASVGVLPDYAPYTLFDRSQLTISGEIQDDPGIASGDRLTKFGLGELVITNDNSGPAGYFGPTFIREGWVTARNSHALGQAINGPDTIQPATYVAPGAALHLKQTRDLAFQNINVPERLFITGNGITHRFPELSQRGALLNLGGNNVYSGIVTLVGTPTDDKVGIGADIDPTDVSVVTSSLRFINTIQEGLPDQPNSSTGYPAQATVPPTGIEKLGRKRVILQGPGTFSGNNDIVEGVLRIQNNIALGMLTGTTTVFDGSAIEVQGYTTANNGGLPGGIQVRETLILSGAGNVTADDPTHDFTSPVLVHTLTNRSDDNIWNGPITLQTDVSIDTQTNSRLALWKTISGTGGFTKYNDGKLILGGNNSYAGTTTINAGILNLQSPTALGTTTGGTVVANDAQIELQGDITIGGEQLTIQGDGVNTTPSFPLRWFPQGPGPINDVTWQGGTTTGRVNSVAVDPRDSNVMYVGAADGGLWRTKNNGYTWEQLIDNTGGVGGNQILFVGSIKVAPTDSNTIYVAFGDANNRSDSYYGRGVLKSSDYGRTWTLIQPPGNLFDRTTISQLVVDPINPNIIYVAVQGDGVNAAPPANYGIWRFNGTTWTNLTASGFNSTNRFSDLVVYDASGQLAPNNRVIAFAIGNIDGSNAPAVYISTDAGASFTSASFPTTPDSGFVDRNGRIKIGSVRLSGNQIQFLAAITYPVNAARQAQGTSGTFRELLTTTATYDPATTLWTVATWGAFGTQPSPQGSNAGYQADQGQFQSVITVNPNNPNYIFLAGFGGTTTTGPLVWNGTAWIDVDPGSDGKGPHNLYYAAAWRPDNTLIVGTAGGIWQLNNNTPPAAGNNANWVNKNGNFLQITQFTGFDVHPFNPFIAVGGSKDNGTEIFGDSPYWTNVEDGDGTVVAINNVNPNIIYRRLNNNTLRRSLDGGVTWAAVGSANGLATFTLDRNNPSRMLIGVGTSIRETKNAEGAATFIELGNNANNGLGNISLIGLANRQGAWQNDPSFPLAVDNGDDAYDPATIYLMTSNGHVESRRIAILLGPAHADLWWFLH